MTAKELKERVLELGANEGFMQKLESAESREDIAALLKENGIQEAPEAVLTALSDETEGELKETELENVAGGTVYIMGFPLALRVAKVIHKFVLIA